MTSPSPADGARSLFSETLTRFSVLASALLLVMLGVGARFMVRAIRADGGTWTEYVFYAVYALVLTAGFAGATLVTGGLARRLGGARAERCLALALATIAALAVLSDEVTFALLGLHPYAKLTWSAVATEDVQRLPWWTAVVVLAIVLAALLVAAGLWRVAARPWPGAAWRDLEARLPKRVMLYFPAGLVAFVALDQPDAERVVPRGALPFYALWLAPANAHPDARPAFPMDVARPAAAFARRPTIVFLMADSFRWDVVTPETMPFLSRLAASPSCTSAPRHYASGHITQYGTFSLLSGLEGYAFFPFMQEGRESAPLAALHEAGYRLEGYDASGVVGYSVPPLRTTQFDRYDRFDSNPVDVDSMAIDRTVESLRASAGAPKFVFAFMSSTHATYSHPAAWNRFPTAYDDPRLTTRDRVFNQYRNSAAYVDSLVARVYDVLEPRLATGDAMLFVTGDHGEEFWEHGLTGHSAARFHDVRTRVPMVACFAGAERMRPALSTHADVFPTVFDFMGAAGWDSTHLTGRSMLGNPGDGVVSIAGAGFPVQADTFALVTPTHKFWLRLAHARLDSMIVDRVTDTLDVAVPMTAGVRLDLDRARAAYLRKQRRVLRVDDAS